MEKIASFTINHLTLQRGLYLSRRDTTPSGDIITTWDVRMSEPNRQAPIDGATLHTIEHLAATFLRNHPQWGRHIIYWGPMGCRTGNYLLLSGDYTPTQVLPLLIETMQFIADYDGDIPGASPRDCGNYSYMNIDNARNEAQRYLDEVLLKATPLNLNYPL
ncbi:MAG: S-ribosylhomocysteine lyase [Clostridiales bacterium]|nr:S-ribosylhomocysteine lyase [Clostridiales bacterium]